MYRHVRLGTAVKCTKYSLLQRTDLGQDIIRTIHRTGMLWNAPEAGLFPMWGAIHHLPPSAYHRVPYNQTYWTNWPTAANPYTQNAFWHRTWLLVLLALQPTR